MQIVIGEVERAVGWRWAMRLKCKILSYSLMEMDSYKILHIETVDRREVQLHSPNMEHEAFIHFMKYNFKGRLTCTELVTDASSSLRKTTGMNKPPSVYQNFQYM